MESQWPGSESGFRRRVWGFGTGFKIADPGARLGLLWAALSYSELLVLSGTVWTVFQVSPLPPPLLAAKLKQLKWESGTSFWGTGNRLQVDNLVRELYF